MAFASLLSDGLNPRVVFSKFFLGGGGTVEAEKAWKSSHQQIATQEALAMSCILWAVRLLLRIPQPRVSRNEAMEIARRKVRAEGSDPEELVVVEGLRYWRVVVDPMWMNSFSLLVHQQTGDGDWEADSRDIR